MFATTSSRTRWVLDSERYATGLKLRASEAAESDENGRRSTIPTRVPVPPKARHIDSRPCASSESSCSDRHAMYVFSRRSVHQVLKAAKDSSASPGAQTFNASSNAFFLAG